MSTPDFIGIYDNALTKNQCDELILFFHSSQKKEGGFWKDGGFVVNYNVKKNIEINHSVLSKTPIASNIIFECMAKYKKEYPSLDLICPWRLIDNYTFQMLDGEDAGYKQWHTEHCPGKLSHRILAWMFYLNDAASGTEFIHFPTVDAKMGRCIIWPAAWTHLHRSMPNKSIKYIMSGWISYEE